MLNYSCVNHRNVLLKIKCSIEYRNALSHCSIHNIISGIRRLFNKITMYYHICLDLLTSSSLYYQIKSKHLSEECLIWWFQNATLLVTANNLALNKPTNQSTTDSKYVSSYAVDGNYANRLQHHSCSRTVNRKNARWRVDLPGLYEIKEVVITGRADCCCKFQSLCTVCKKQRYVIIYSKFFWISSNQLNALVLMQKWIKRQNAGFTSSVIS